MKLRTSGAINGTVRAIGRFGTQLSQMANQINQEVVGHNQYQAIALVNALATGHPCSYIAIADSVQL